MGKRSILYIDDDRDSLELVTILFERDGYQVTALNSLDNGLHLFRLDEFCAVILDNWFPEDEIYKVCREMRALKPNIPIVFFSAVATPAEIEKARHAGADLYLTKPEGLSVLPEAVAKLIEEMREAAHSEKKS